jgi:flagellar basal-body rod modification protein FlgD
MGDIMEITSTGVNNATNTDATDTTKKQSTSGADKLANEQVFLQLLVSQIKNQDPLKPTDGAQFVAQLAQFSQLEQLIGIRADISELRAAAEEPQTV